MSILLDALKKSEQQRQLGQTPTLQTHTGDDSAQAGEQLKWIVPVLVAVSVGAMGWFGWAQFRVPESGSVPTVAVAGEQKEETAATTQLTEQKPRTPTESFQEEKPVNKPLLPGGLKLAPQTASNSAAKDKTRVNESFKSFQAKDQPADKAAAEVMAQQDLQRMKLKALAQQDSQRRNSGAQQAEKPVTRTAQAAPRPVENNAERRSSRVKPHVAEPISYWELPQGVRDNLPEIKISVLVYAERPGDRFLLTGGQRMAEKDELQSGLVLDEIRRDGAIFVYRNYRFLVKG